MTKWLCEKRQFRESRIQGPRSKERMQISDGTIPGLYLRYSPGTNYIRFYLGCRIEFKHRNILIGKYGEITVPQAKDKAREMRTMEGIDAMLAIMKTGSQGVWEWQHKKHTEKEIILTLRLLGYKIDPAITGSNEQHQIYW